MFIASVMPSNHLILCRPLLLLPSIFPSIRIFSSKSVLRIRWPEYWTFSFSISPFSEYSELISFRMDWFDLLQAKDSSLLQHHSSKASIFSHNVQFFIHCWIWFANILLMIFAFILWDILVCSFPYTIICVLVLGLFFVSVNIVDKCVSQVQSGDRKHETFWTGKF